MVRKTRVREHSRRNADKVRAHERVLRDDPRDRVAQPGELLPRDIKHAYEGAEQAYDEAIADNASHDRAMEAALDSLTESLNQAGKTTTTMDHYTSLFIQEHPEPKPTWRTVDTKTGNFDVWFSEADALGSAVRNNLKVHSKSRFVVEEGVDE